MLKKGEVKDMDFEKLKKTTAKANKAILEIRLEIEKINKDLKSKKKDLDYTLMENRLIVLRNEFEARRKQALLERLDSLKFLYKIFEEYGEYFSLNKHLNRDILLETFRLKYDLEEIGYDAEEYGYKDI